MADSDDFVGRRHELDRLEPASWQEEFLQRVTEPGFRWPSSAELRLAERRAARLYATEAALMMRRFEGSMITLEATAVKAAASFEYAARMVNRARIAIEDARPSRIRTVVCTLLGHPWLDYANDACVKRCPCGKSAITLEALDRAWPGEDPLRGKF